MKSKATYLPDELADELTQISSRHRCSESKVIQLALEKLVLEVRETGRLPLPPEISYPAATGA